MPVMAHLDLSVVIVVDAETDTLTQLLAGVEKILIEISIEYEIIVVNQQRVDPSRVVSGQPIRYVQPSKPGYGSAVLTGLEHAGGDYIVTMDACHDCPTSFLLDLWQNRETADVVIASRYVPGGQARMPLFRRIASRVLNAVFSRGLDLRVSDLSSGFRMYRGSSLKMLDVSCGDYDILQEILVNIFMQGYQIREIPFEYRAEDKFGAAGRMFAIGLAYLKTFSRLWKKRNSIASADYDARAYDALMPPQRYWQRQRYKHITGLLQGQGKCLDIGCGSSWIIGALPAGSLALDILLRKLRFARRFGHPVVQGSVFNLPIPNEAFPCVVCSQVIEHIPRDGVLDEIDRVLEPGGLLILGTPDYAKWQWVVIEWLYKLLLPQAYADEHITHYTYAELYFEFMSKRKYRLEAVRYILQGELILSMRKSA